MHSTSTLYIGNLSFYTTEEQITELFAKCGDLKRVVMGLDKVKRVKIVPLTFLNQFISFRHHADFALSSIILEIRLKMQCDGSMGPDSMTESFALTGTVVL